MANRDNLYEEEVEMLSKLPKKFESFSGNNIDIGYLDPWESDMIVKEMMLPCPKWAQEEELQRNLDKQNEDEVAGIFERRSFRISCSR